MNAQPFLALTDEVWLPVRDANPTARNLFDRHYSRRRGGTAAKFVGPGEYMALLTHDGAAMFLWRLERFRQDGQQGVNCAIFRNESEHRSSDLIREAVRLAWERWPGARLYTYVNPRRVESTNPGYCFKCAGWRKCGESKRGLHILELLP